MYPQLGFRHFCFIMLEIKLKYFCYADGTHRPQSNIYPTNSPQKPFHCVILTQLIKINHNKVNINQKFSLFVSSQCHGSWRTVNPYKHAFICKTIPFECSVVLNV